MRTFTLTKTKDNAWAGVNQPSGIENAQLVLYFGSRAVLENPSSFAELRSAFPHAQIVGCTTGGQLIKAGFSDEVATATAVYFDSTDIVVARETIEPDLTSLESGRRLGSALSDERLTSVLVLSDGLQVNGSELVRGLTDVLGPKVVITGGLAGDGASFEKTLVGVNDLPRSGQIAAIGFYGSKLIVGHGSAGGWSEFGPKRQITKSSGNVLFELDGKPALDLYKLYLGDEAKGLPGTALLYPLLVSDPGRPENSLVRTVLSVDHEASTMTFAGDIPEGWSAQLMRGYFDRLAEGAALAAQSSLHLDPRRSGDCLSILISCIGRRLLMGENIVDEIEAARQMLGPGTECIGFYSYGEIAPHQATGIPGLHNQTMTVTTLSEAA
jgi:hypothetical protein